MTTPTILFNDVPKIHFWGSTAPYEVIEEDDPNHSKDLYHQNHSGMENSIAENRSEDSSLDEADQEEMETIFADPSLEFVMIPANIYGDIQDSNSSVDSCRNDESTKRRRNTINTGSEIKNSSRFGRFLNGFRSSVQSKGSPRLTHEQKQSSPATKTSRRAPTRSSTIYSSYDWVSEVVIDEEGRRLILPGELVVMDTDSREMGQNNKEKLYPFPSSEHPCLTADGSDSENPAGASRRRTDLSSLFETSTIMVSAHDLLATQTINCEDDEMDLERISRASPHSSLMFPGYHTATLSTKVVSSLRRLAFQKLDRIHNNVVYTTSRLTNCVASQLEGAESHFQILAVVSDLAIQGCDWLFPTHLRELEDCTGAPSDPIGDAHVSIEMTMLEIDENISKRLDAIT